METIRRRRVSLFTALMTQKSICLRADGGKQSHSRLAAGASSSAEARSSGSSSASKMCHHPFALATSIAVRPRRVIRRWASSRATRALLVAAQPRTPVGAGLRVVDGGVELHVGGCSDALGGMRATAAPGVGSLHRADR